MSNGISESRMIRATTKHEVGVFEKRQETNAVKYATHVPMSFWATVGAVAVGIPTLFLGTLLFIGIHRYCHRNPDATKAMHKEQAEAACGVIFARKEKSEQGADFIEVNLSIGDTITGIEKHGNLWIKTNDGNHEEKHPELDTIDKLKLFYRDDIKNNIDYYIEKNPDNQLLKLFKNAIFNENIDELFDLMEKTNGSDSLDELQTNIRVLEEVIENNHKNFKGILQVEVTELKRENQTVFAHNVTFGDARIARIGLAVDLNPKLFQPAPAIIYGDQSATAVSKPKTLNGLLNKVRSSPDSVSFQANILKLDNFCEQTEEDYKKLKLEIKPQNSGNSVVTVNIDGIELEFKGKLQLNDRLFDKVPNENGPTSVYQLKQKTEQAQYIQELYIQSADMNAAVYANPFSKQALLKAHDSLSEGVFKGIRRDMSRSGPSLPVRTDTSVGSTREDYFTACRNYLSPDLSAHTDEFKDLYANYSGLTYDDQCRLYQAVDGPQDERESELSKIKNNDQLVEIKNTFDLLGQEEKIKMAKCFNFFCTGEFVGTDKEFEDAVNNKLPLKEKMEFLMLYQAFETPTASLDTTLVASAIKRCEMPVQRGKEEGFNNIAQLDEKKQSAQLRFERHIEYKYGTDMVARAFVTPTYSVAIPENGGLGKMKLKFHEEKLKYNLVILNQDGSTPTVCKNAFIAGEWKPPIISPEDRFSMEEFNYQQLHRAVCLSNAYVTI